MFQPTTPLPSRRRVCINRRFVLLTMAGLLTGICGCSRSDMPDLGQVTGIVTQAGQPSENALVEFYPSDGRPSLGRTGADGRYELIYTPGHPGATVGTHTVRITPGRAAPPPTAPSVDQEMPPLPVDATSGVLTWPLPVTVTSGENTIDFELTTASAK